MSLLKRDMVGEILWSSQLKALILDVVQALQNMLPGNMITTVN